MPFAESWGCHVERGAPARDKCCFFCVGKGAFLCFFACCAAKYIMYVRYVQIMPSYAYFYASECTIRSKMSTKEKFLRQFLANILKKSLLCTQKTRKTKRVQLT